jgi:hypothetical protein
MPVPSARASNGLMRNTIASVMLVLAVSAAACTKDTSTGPSNSTTTTSVATTTVATTTVTTTTAPAFFTVRGRITSEKDGSAAQFADIEIIQGVGINQRFQADSNGNYTMPNRGVGAFVMRVGKAGFLIKDVSVNVVNSDLTVDVQLTPAPPPTTTVLALQANFTFSPNPCTISPGNVVNCTVDSSTSTGDITTRRWNYGGKEIIDQVTHSLSFQCSDLIGSGGVRTISVRLTVQDAGGNISTVDNGVPVSIVGNACP